jgi:excisionase family DNA binding protein
MSDTEYFSVDEVAEMFNTTIADIKKLIQKEEIPAIEIRRGKYRISSETIENIKDSGLFDVKK